jgi:YYY domain-containing protein
MPGSIMNLFRWWLALEFLGLVGLPVAASLFPGLKDWGISLCRVIGLVLVSYPVWVVSHWGEVYGTPLVIFFCFVMAIVSGILCLTEWKKWAEILKSPGELIVSEIVFLAAFLGLALIRSYNPEIEGMWKGGGSEKFMDLNFVNSILNSSQFPPRDNWLSGFPINYYYYGYYLAAMLIQLSGVLPHVGYNLMVVTVYALAVQGMWGLLRNLGCRWYWALLGVYLAFFATNLKAPKLFFQLPAAGENFIPWESSRVIWLPNDHTINEYPWFTYLWSDLHGHLSALPFQMAILGLCWGALTSLRKIGNKRQVRGALLISLTFGCLAVTNAWDLPAFGVVILTSLLAGYSLKNDAKIMTKGLGILVLGLLITGAGASRVGFPPQIPLIVCLLGGCILLILSTRVPTRFLDLRLASFLLLRLCAVTAVFYVLYRPFFSYFVPPTSGHANVPWDVKSPLGLWLLIFGAFLGLLAIPLAGKVCTLVWTLSMGSKSPSSSNQVRMTQILLSAVMLVGWAAGILFIRSKTGSTDLTLTPALLLTLMFGAGLWATWAWFEQKDESDSVWEFFTAERFVILLLILAGGLILGCEFVAVNDFYGTDSIRMNTVFKFHMQAWVLLAVVCAFLCNWLVNSPMTEVPVDSTVHKYTRPLQILAKSAQVCLVIVMVGWTLIGTWAVMAVKCSHFETTPTLDGLAYALPENSGQERPGGPRDMSTDDAKAILWLLDLQRFDFDANRLILEVPGDPYSIFGRISAFTGIPTLIGVPNHEHIWNGKNKVAMDSMAQRLREAETIYKTSDFRKSKDLLEKYKITHVFWGTVEKNKYGAQAGRKFKKYMKEVKSFGGTTIYAGYQDIPIESVPQIQEIPPQPLAGVRLIEDANHALNQPRGITVAKDGLVYVCNSKAGRVDCFNQEGAWVRSIGTPGQTPNSGELSPEFSGLGGVAVGDDGTVYVADTWRHRIAVYGPDGTYQREILSEFWGPRNLILFQNNLVVADTGKNRLVVLSREGNVVRQVGTEGEGTGEFSEPVGLAVHQDLLFVGDTGNHRVQVFGPDYLARQEFEVLGWEDKVGTEAYMTIDSKPSLWLTDSGHNRLQRFGLDGKLLGIFGPATSEGGGLVAPKGLGFFNGNLVISDFGKNRLVICPVP